MRGILTRHVDSRGKMVDCAPLPDRYKAVYEMEGGKHVRFGGRLVFVGFGSVGQGSLPLLLRHIDMPYDRISIVTGDERGRAAHEDFYASGHTRSLVFDLDFDGHRFALM